MTLDKIPKDLPVTNPLLFSFLVILDAVNFQVNFSGGSERIDDKDLPAFEYAVNTWQTIENPDYPNGGKTLSQTVLCALWKQKPSADCKVYWGKDYPVGGGVTQRKKQIWDLSFKLQFEKWRTQTFQELNQIITGLLRTGTNTDRQPPTNATPKFLADIYGFVLADPVITYVYALDQTSGQFYGVGATFTLNSHYINCCPRVEENNLKLDYFKSLGFTFDGCNITE